MHLYECQWAFKLHAIQMTSIFSHCTGLHLKDLPSYQQLTPLSQVLFIFYKSTNILFVLTSGFLPWAQIQEATLDLKVT